MIGAMASAMGGTLDGHRRQRSRPRLGRAAAVLVLACLYLAASAIISFGERSEMSPDGEMMREEGVRRLLAAVGRARADADDDLSIPGLLLRAGEEGQMSAEEVLAEYEGSLPPRTAAADAIAPYDILDAARTSRLFETGYGVLVYDNEKDEFLLLRSESQEWTVRCQKLSSAYAILTMLLRRTFPERFCGPSCPELAISITAGDYPHLRKECLVNYPHALPKCSGDAPILHFGSVFRSPEIYPGMIAMPMPGQHLKCLGTWAEQDEGTNRRVCEHFTPKRWRGSEGLAFGDDSLTWEDLAPQLVWRGTDFNYLRCLYGGRSYRNVRGIPPDVQAIEDPVERKRAATRAMRENYDKMLPRWQGVVLTAEARREEEEAGGASTAWADMSFAKAAPIGIGRGKGFYEELAEAGIPALGGRLSSEELSLYRYHIDIGGGGGTTWTGTVQKLAMPGLLFHHVTPTKDYIHDRMTPWIDHVPVRSDLSDLREKYDWAEAHPEAAGAIARRGTELMRRLGTAEGFEEMFREGFAEPLRAAMDAYVPAATSHPGVGWRDVLEGAEGIPRMVPKFLGTTGRAS